MDNANNIRHSLAHLLAMAALKYDKDAKLGIGPVIDNGFYYDILFSKPFSELELPNLEKEMRSIIQKDLKFSCVDSSAEEAASIFKDNEFKLEIIDGLKNKGEKITLYKTGDDFIDLCKGGHVNSAKEIPKDCFTLTHIAGAYWRGNEKNQMLTRIFGLAFSSKEELISYQKAIEEQKKNDHRILNEKLEFFTISEEVGKGLPIYLPNGAYVVKKLQDFMYKQEILHGYKHTITPILARKHLYEKSGHLAHYAKDMYSPIEIEGEEYYLRPMNCPHHHQVFKYRPLSYNDLPLRLAEFGLVHRFERSGVLTGIIRTRSFTQNDAHIYCQKMELKNEIIKILLFFKDIIDVFHIKNYWYRISLPDFQNEEKFGNVKNKSMWDEAANFIKSALEELKISYIEEVGEAAFYGPKIDIQMKNVNMKEDTLGTIQIDFYSSNRFNLSFINNKGEKEEPVIIHHAILGSFERFFAFLIEQYKGELPLWLCPTQVLVLPVSDKYIEYAKQIQVALADKGFLAEIDSSNNTLGKKVRNAKEVKVPYYLVIGAEEQQSNTITAESRLGKVGVLSLDDFIRMLQKII